MTGCMMCGAPVEFPEYTDLCNACEDANLAYANREWPCCGRTADYCDCSPWQRDYALMRAAVLARAEHAPRVETDPPF